MNLLEILKKADTDAFLFLNGWHSPFTDRAMYLISHTWVWLPLYLFLLWLVIRNYRKQSLVIIPAAALLITLGDRVSVLAFKEVFERLRPCHEPSLSGLVHTVYGHCGGDFSFVSSHATNTFAAATFLALLIGRRYRYFTPLIFLWATVVSYSRIYLGVHYPGDVVGGALLGSALGISVIMVTRLVIRKTFRPAPG